MASSADIFLCVTTCVVCLSAKYTRGRRGIPYPSQLMVDEVINSELSQGMSHLVAGITPNQLALNGLTYESPDLVHDRVTHEAASATRDRQLMRRILYFVV